VRYRLSLNSRVSARISQARRILHVDTQHTRKKLVVELEELFEIASSYARGKVQRVVVDEAGKTRPLTIAERQFYARIAGYTAQTINSLTKGIDERQIDADLNRLEAMLNKTTSTITVEAAGREPPRKSEGP